MAWGDLDVPLLAINQDWYGAVAEPQACYSLIQDQQQLWFVASHRKSAVIHPKAKPGVFREELWKYDVAELFISHEGGRYFEFNLSPNAAWWSCEFVSPRQRAEEMEIAMPDVQTYAEIASDGSWLAAMSLPLDLLKARLDFGEHSKANVTMILDSPKQRFFSVVALPGAQPDFHQPEAFSNVRFVALQDVMK